MISKKDYLLSISHNLFKKCTLPEADPGGGLRGLQAPPPLWEVFKLVWLPMSIPFYTKTNIINYNISSSPIDHYKKIVAIPILDSLIIQIQDRFLTENALPAICFV